MIFWEQVIDELQKKNHNYSDLAIALDIPRSTVIGWVNNGRFPPADKALNIADFLELDLRSLITGKEQGYSKEQSRWLAWLEKHSDQELHHARKLLEGINSLFYSAMRDGVKTLD